MLYSSGSLLALIILLIINHDVLLKKAGSEIIPARRSYRAFLAAVALYYVTDILWGLLYDAGLTFACYVDTCVYFVAMAFSALLWARYAVAYTGSRDRYGRILLIAGQVCAVFIIASTVVNCFVPFLFYFDADGAYHAAFGRYISLILQVAMFLFAALYTFRISGQREGAKKYRYRAIGIFSLSMIAFVVAQVLLPLLPMYAIGCMLGTCVLHTFVLENEKEEYRDQLESRLQENVLQGNYYDLLTGLPGMSHFFELARKKREAALARKEPCAFLYMNLNGMKFFNQQHGFAAGDRLLHAFAQQLISAFGKENCSRFGQDHFVVITEQIGLEAVLEKFFRAWASSAPAEGPEHPAVMVGIYRDHPDPVDISTACDYAKIACDDIPYTFASVFRNFDAKLKKSTERQHYFLTHLSQAMSENWIQVYYQPIIRTASGLICSEEALARWMDPGRGLISPGEFIPVLEEANVIYRLDLYIVEQVLEKLKRFRKKGLPLVPQSVNLSRSDFDMRDMVEEIRQRVDQAGIPRNLLNIEITESVLGSDFDFIEAQVKRFRQLGFPVWLDDFGNGYSSLDVLQRMDVDLIKFDMRFMQEFDHGNRSRIILTELMKMAQALGIDTICEGVEREDQIAFLRDIGCSRLQGFYYCKPIPEEEILRLSRQDGRLGFENPKE